MRAIDVHCHMSTKRGYPVKPELIKASEAYFRLKVTYKTEEEMVKDLRDADVKCILKGPAVTISSREAVNFDEVKENHDYVGSLLRQYPDVFLGGWADIDPRLGLKALRELERCIKDLGMVGPSFFPGTSGLPYNDESYYPFYEMCIEANRPVLLYVGMTGLGAGLPGGGGHVLGYYRPVPYIDEVAAKFPELTIIASRYAWPWQDEMRMVLLHKRNVYNEIHGWLPKYISPEFKKDLGSRLQDKVLFGTDYPNFTYEQLAEAWQAEGYTSQVLRKFFVENAQRVLGLP